MKWGGQFVFGKISSEFNHKASKTVSHVFLDQNLAIKTKSDIKTICESACGVLSQKLNVIFTPGLQNIQKKKSKRHFSFFWV